MTLAEINRRSLLVAGVAGVAGVAAAATPACANAPAPKKANRPFVINALGGFENPNRREENDAEGPEYEIDARAIADARAAGLAAVNATLGFVFGEGDPFVVTIDDIAWYDEAIRRGVERLAKVWTAADIRAAHEAGKVGVIYGVQNSDMFGGDADRARLFSNLGLRIVQLTYNLRNAAGDGALVSENRGLTDFGRDLVAALNEQRLLVDLSHGGEKLTLDAIAASKRPPAITHTGCAALAPHPRNKTDAELKALADKGGVMGVYFMPYLTPGRQHRAADVVRHIEHAIDVCGEDHVGLGTDLGVTAVDDMAAYLAAHRKNAEERKRLGVAAPNEDPDIVLIAPDLNGPAQFEKLAALLSARGHSGARIEKISGGNFLRLFGEVWG